MDPPGPPEVRYFHSKSAAQNLSFLYRVIRLQEQQTCRCYPEARDWPILTMTPWKWYLERGGDSMSQRLPRRLARFRNSFKTLTEVIEPTMWRHQLLGLSHHSQGSPVSKLEHLFGKNAPSCITAES